MAALSVDDKHFHVLIFCALPKEREAAVDVFQKGTKSTFVESYTTVIAGLEVYRKWNDTPLTVAAIAQKGMGTTGCTGRLTELQRLGFTVDLAVMTGICAGVEDVNGPIGYGSVVVADRTVLEQGKTAAGGKHLPDPDPAKLDGDLKAAIETVRGKLQNFPRWIDAYRPSPRYAQELILDAVTTGSDKLEEILKVIQAADGSGNMDDLDWQDIMKKMAEPDGCQWIQSTDSVVTATEKGRYYKAENQPTFPRKDKISVVLYSIGTIQCVTEDLPNQLPGFKERMSSRKLKGIDMEAHHFMTHSKETFPNCQPLVMKGISDNGTPQTKQIADYYQGYAASTPAAFLRHLLGQPSFFNILSSKFKWRCSLSEDGQDEVDGATDGQLQIVERQSVERDLASQGHGRFRPNEVSDIQILEVAKAVRTSWKEIGTYLRFTREELAEYEVKYRGDMFSSLWDILHKWKQREEHATIAALLEACRYANVEAAAKTALKSTK